jgi:hypothetical protein
MRSLAVDEGVAFAVEEGLRGPLRVACHRVQQQIAPRAPVLEEAAGTFTVRGVVGTIALRPGVVLDVAPKVAVEADWIAATLDLLLSPDRIDVAGDRRSGIAQRRDLLDVLAGIYADRLRGALRRDGPILVMERRTTTAPVLKGKLRTSAWARRAAWEPHRFPVAFQELAADNDYSRALAHVAHVLARGACSPRTRGSLLDSARALRPGAPELTHAETHLALRRLPSQWSAYAPAWDIAVSVLTRRSLLGSVGARHGVSVALETWPLLERLLERALHAAVRAGRDSGRMISAPAKHATTLLRAAGDGALPVRSVIPDGRLVEDARHVATFEAKYARCDAAAGPPREHVFQALATAAACQSPLAVLVYPDDFAPAWWRVSGWDGAPRWLAAIGLGLFGYRRGAGDRARGARLLELLAGPPSPETRPAVSLAP